MEHDNFDTELFIDEVEKRIIIWDMESTDYSNRNLRRRAWEELVEIFCNPGDSDENKKLLGTSLQKKWKGLRDCFVREMKKKKTAPSGFGASSKNPYIYFQRLMFLERSVRNKTSDANIEDTSDKKLPLECTVTSQDDEEVIMRPPSNKLPTKKKKMSAADADFFNIIQNSITSRAQHQPHASCMEYDEEKLFCLSLHKELLKVPEDIRLQTKIELMNIIHRAQQVPRHTQSVNNSP